MAVRQPRYSKEEFAQRGDALYETEVRSQVEEGNHGKIVAIDIETGAFEVADDILPATDRLFERLPDAQPWIVRIGHRVVHRFGSQSLKKSV
jgi:peptide subunit release factor RF-3